MKLRVEDGSPGEEGPSRVPEPGLASDDKGPWGSSSRDGSGSANALVCRQGAGTGTGEGDRQAGTLPS